MWRDRQQPVVSQQSHNLAMKGIFLGRSALISCLRSASSCQSWRPASFMQRHFITKVTLVWGLVTWPAILAHVHCGCWSRCLAESLARVVIFFQCLPSTPPLAADYRKCSFQWPRETAVRRRLFLSPCKKLVQKAEKPSCSPCPQRRRRR